MPDQAASPTVIRQLSRRGVFEALLHKGPISRADLSKVTGLSKQTISEVIDAFEQQSLVRRDVRADLFDRHLENRRQRVHVLTARHFGGAK